MIDYELARQAPDRRTGTVTHALARLGQPADPRAAAAAARRWRPWRSYALQHLWGVLQAPAGPGGRPAPDPGAVAGPAGPEERAS